MHAHGVFTSSVPTLQLAMRSQIRTRVMCGVCTAANGSGAGHRLLCISGSPYYRAACYKVTTAQYSPAGYT